MEKSTHAAPVIELNREVHPNADSLSLIRIDGYTVVINTKDWEGRTKACWIQPESIVELARPEFAWLNDGKGQTHHKVRVRKFRGIVSYGLLVPAPEGSSVGDDLADTLGITHYDPEAAADAGISYKAPADFSKYDVDAFLKYHKLFVDGETVKVTEKLHGSNMRVVFDGAGVKVGSRSYWKPDVLGCQFWAAFRSDERIDKFVRDNPGVTLFGEQYGHNKGMKYGCKDGESKFAAFDVMRPDGIYEDGEDLEQISTCIPWVPKLPTMEYNFDEVKALAEGKTLVSGADHIREGVVVSPFKERFDDRLGRIKVKVINPAYLEKH